MRTISVTTWVLYEYCTEPDCEGSTKELKYLEMRLAPNLRQHPQYRDMLGTLSLPIVAGV